MRHARILPGLTLLAVLGFMLAHCVAGEPMARYNVVWESPSKDASGQMPLGNGDIAAGVYAIEDGGALVAQSYNVFRFLMACQSRGRIQTKFNGGLFTLPLRSRAKKNEAVQQKDGSWLRHEDDRDWGRRFTFQNQRLLYWPLLMSGDGDLMRPFFDYYSNLLPIRKAITKAWFGHEGAYYRENIEPTGGERDCGRTGKPPKTKPGENRGKGYYHSYYFTAGLETLAMMTEYVKYSGEVINGRLTDWTIEPATRKKDVVVHQPQRTPQRPVVPDNEHPLRIGADQVGGNQFRGKIGRVTMFRDRLTPDTIRTLAEGDRKKKVTIDPVVGCVLEPKAGDVLPVKAEELHGTVSFEAWILPEEREAGRILDKVTGGQGDGFLLDCWPNLSLRLIVGNRQKDLPGVLKPGVWQHVAVVIRKGKLDVYLNGDER